MIVAQNSYFLAFVRLSDALCRLASGGSFAVQQFYSDDEEVLFEAALSYSSGKTVPKTRGSTLG